MYPFFFQSLTHFQPYIEESLAGGRERSRGHFMPASSLDSNELPGILPPPAKMFSYDNSDSSDHTTSSSLHTFPRQRRLIDCHGTTTFLPPPPPPHCDDFASHGTMSKSDRRKTVTFLGDVETIPPCDENVTSDFFPLPPPLLPLIENDGGDNDHNVNIGQRSTLTSSSSTSNDSKSVKTDSPDYVESSV